MYIDAEVTRAPNSKRVFVEVSGIPRGLKVLTLGVKWCGWRKVIHTITKHDIPVRGGRCSYTFFVPDVEGLDIKDMVIFAREGGEEILNRRVFL